MAICVGIFSPAASADQTPATVRVVLDNDYPPYIFLDKNGNPQGIVKDLWSLWERRTGIHVDLRPMEWSQALATMKSGQADVIDTIFDTPERRAFYDFSKPYASLNVNIFFRKDLSGITDADSLKGFTVGVKDGDACIEYLTARGITTLKPYPSYNDEVEAAIHNELRVMCIDKPPAVYLLNHFGQADNFRISPPLYVGQFHWAITKGHDDLRRIIEEGFSRITPADRDAINEHWLGESVPYNTWFKWVMYAVASLGLIVLSLVFWNRVLHSRVADRTRKLSTALDSLKDSEQRYRTLIDATSAVTWSSPPSGLNVVPQPQWMAFTGQTAEEMRGSGWVNALHPDDRTLVGKQWQEAVETHQPFSSEYRVRRHDGVWRWMKVYAVPVVNADGGLTEWFGMGLDISERKETEEKVQHMAYHDLLTGLPNRALFMDRLNQVLAVAGRTRRYGAIIFIDLDQFKKINDVYGHGFGDAVLKDVAVRISDFMRQGDTVARFGGDEFIILLPDLSTDQATAATLALKVAEKLRAALEEPSRMEGQAYSGTASIGITLFPGHAETAENLIRGADIAMYRAKERGRNAIVLFESDMQVAIAERFALEQEMREALNQNAMELFLQSKVDRTGKIIGAESLVRWRHPTRGLVLPTVFIPLAEETGFIVSIGEWVLRETCRLIAELSAQGRSLHISVNVSPRQFHQADFVSRVQGILAETGADPLYLTLEVTENLLVEGTADAVSRMLQLAELGIRFSIDDFGTGYSSLSYLKRLPLNEIKIDKSFVQDIPYDPNDVAIVETILSMAHHLGFIVVAEGVETEKQFQFLAEHDCEQFQGYFFHRPQPKQEWLSNLE